MSFSSFASQAICGTDILSCAVHTDEAHKSCKVQETAEEAETAVEMNAKGMWITGYARTVSRFACICVFAIGFVATAAAQTPTLRIGIAVPDSGPYVLLADLMRRGAQVAVDEINANGGISGERLELVVTDDGCSADEGRDAANRLTGAGVIAAIGHVCYSGTRAAAPIYAASGIIHFTLSNQVPALTGSERPPSFFRVAPRDDRVNVIISDALIGSTDNGPIALLDDGSIYGSTLVDGVRQDLIARGRPANLIQSFEPGATEFNTLIRDLQDERIAAVFVASYHEDLAALAQAMTAARLRPTIVTPETGANAEVKALAGDALNRMVVVKPREWMNSDLQTRHGIAQTGAARYFLGAHAAVNAWADAYAASGEGSVAAALQNGNFDTAIGPLGFTSEGDLSDVQFTPHRWIDGVLVPAR
ncbi:MAG: branched-chain amino acid ABC transporter substrate-binding protein [Pseudomonadota bacterium]